MEVDLNRRHEPIPSGKTEFASYQSRTERKIENLKKIIPLVLKAVAVGISVVSIVMEFLPDVATVDTHITLLSIGLFTLAVAALQKEE
jgi:hypothetical protein